jgi:sec-independent protein translocase protein TatA
MDTIGPSELLIILLVLVAIFGASRLPRMARSLGEGIREFRTALRDTSRSADSGSDPEGRITGSDGPATDGGPTP